MSRVEVVRGLQAQAQTPEGITVRRGARNKARRELQQATETYQRKLDVVLSLELARGYRIAVFGSAGLKPDDKEYQFVTALSQRLVEEFDADIVTGGGPGLMEAANFGSRRAREVDEQNGKHHNGKNHGVGIKGMSREQGLNEHVEVAEAYDEFLPRIARLAAVHGAFVAQGGVGTEFEQFKFIQDLQRGKAEEDFTLVLDSWWKRLFDLRYTMMYTERVEAGETPLIAKNDFDFIKFSHNIDEIVGMFKQGYEAWKAKIGDHVTVLENAANGQTTPTTVAMETESVEQPPAALNGSTPHPQG